MMMNKNNYRYPMSDILNFLNTYENWEEMLIHDFNVNVRHEGDYFLLKYDSRKKIDFSQQFVRECRGSIFRYDENRQKYICVCAPFIKFFNEGEDYSDEIDYNNIIVTEKLDGTLINVWYDRCEWHISTIGQIDAYKTHIGNGHTYGKLFEKAIREKLNHQVTKGLNYLFDIYLARGYTFMFELVSPEAPVVIEYNDTKAYLLAARQNFNKFIEFSIDDMNVIIKNAFDRPKEYFVECRSNIEDILQNMDNNYCMHEGIVVCDNNFHRLKLKTRSYLEEKYSPYRGIITVKRLITYWRNGEWDNFYRYCSDNARKRADKFRIELYALMIKLDELWKMYSENYPEKREYVEQVKNMNRPNIIKTFLLKKKNNPEYSAFDYLNNISIDNLTSYLNTRM